MKIDSAGRRERPEHAAHDQILVARFAARDVTDAEADAARSLISSCADCRLLASDLLAIAHATADLPAPARIREFRLTPERAAELRRPAAISWLSRVIGSGRASGRLVPLQRLAAAAVAIGLVMAVVTSPAGIPGFSTGSGSSKAAGQVSESRAVGAAPGLAVAPNAATPASAEAFPAGASGAPAAAAAAGASPAVTSVQVPLGAAPAAAPIVGAVQSPAAARPATSAPAAPALAGGPSSAPPTPSPAAAASTGPAIGSTTITSQASPLTALAPQPANRSGAIGQPAPQGERAATGEPFGPWQGWLVVVAAGLLVLVLVRLSLRRPA